MPHRLPAALLPLAVVAILAAAVSAQPVTTVKMYIPGAGTPTQTKPIEDAVAAFQRATPSVRVDLQIFGWGEIQTKILTELAAGVGPDIFMHGGAATALFASRDASLPLDKYLARWGKRDDFYPGLLAETSYQGQVHAIPLVASNIGLLCYRKDLLRAAGLDPAKPPSTWTELRAAARRLTRYDGSRLVQAGFWVPTSAIPYTEQIWATFLWANGGDLLNDDRTQAAFNSPEGVEALEYYVSFIKDRVFVPGVVEDVPQVPHLVTGKAAMIPCGSFDLAAFKQFGGDDLYEQIAVAPPVAGKERATLAGQNVFFISRTSKNPDAAWKVLEYVLRDDVHARITEAAGFLPARKSMAGAAFLKADPRLPAFAGSLRWAHGNPNIPQWIEVRTRIVRAIEEAASGRKSAKQALDDAAEDVNRILGR